MKRSTFESIKSVISTLGRPMNEDRVAHMEISTVERLNFKRRTVHVPNLMHKLLQFFFTTKHCRPLYIVKMNRVWLILSSTSESGIKFDTWKGRRLNWSLGPKRRTIIFWTGLGGRGVFTCKRCFYMRLLLQTIFLCVSIFLQKLYFILAHNFFSVFSAFPTIFFLLIFHPSPVSQKIMVPPLEP